MPVMRVKMKCEMTDDYQVVSARGTNPDAAFSFWKSKFQNLNSSRSKTVCIYLFYRCGWSRKIRMFEDIHITSDSVVRFRGHVGINVEIDQISNTKAHTLSCGQKFDLGRVGVSEGPAWKLKPNYISYIYNKDSQPKSNFWCEVLQFEIKLLIKICFLSRKTLF